MRTPALVVLLAAAIGCGRAEPAPMGTGAREAIAEFYAGLVAEDWSRSYATFDGESRKKLAAPEFARRAEAYRKNLGFVPEGCQVQSCDEKEDRAVAHVVLTGQANGKSRRFKDGAALRKSDDAWRVVLPDAFGKKKP